MKRKAVIFLIAVLAAGSFFLSKGLHQKYPWLGSYLADRFRPNPAHHVKGPQHVMFLFTDHFEPHDPETLKRWAEAYPQMASKYQDAYGRHPQHSWFWFFSESDTAEKKLFLSELSRLAYEGLGEVEFHLHHFNDTEETLTQKINEAVALSKETGAMVTAEERPQTAFGFIHGLWGLDNSRGPGACGVNNELMILRRLGCYADYTHPSWGAMHPSVVNRIYYATDDPREAKSYDKGRVMEAGKPGFGDLVIFEGPSVIHFEGAKPVYDHGDVSHETLPTPERIDGWVKAGVHVRGRPEWIFIKVFSHSALAESREAVLGAWGDKLHAYLNKHYNDGKKYILHYVTAREAYNIAKAAEAGKTGDPDLYRDFLIPPYVNRFFIASAPFETVSFSEGAASFRFLAPGGTEIEARLRGKEVEVSGDASVIKIENLENETRVRFTLIGSGLVAFRWGRWGTVLQGTVPPGTPLLAVSAGLSLSGPSPGGPSPNQ